MLEKISKTFGSRIAYNHCVCHIIQNVKSYLRRGTAREMLGYYKEAIDGLYLDLSLFPCFAVKSGSLTVGRKRRNALYNYRFSSSCFWNKQ